MDIPNIASALLAQPTIIWPLALITSYLLIIISQALLRTRHKKPLNLPTVGLDPAQHLALLRARWRNALAPKTAITAAYAAHKHTTSLLPVAGAHDFVLLPAHETAWFFAQPDSIFSGDAYVQESLQLRHTVPDRRIAAAGVPPAALVPGRLTREVGRLVPALVDEIRACVDQVWAVEEEEEGVAARAVCVYGTVQRLVARVVGRALVGAPLCRSEAVLGSGIAYAMALPMVGQLLNSVWRPLRPLVALVLTLPMRLHVRRYYAAVKDEIVRRLRDYDAPGAAHTKKGGWGDNEPNDLLQWAIQLANNTNDSYMLRPYVLTVSLLTVTFAAIHTTSFTLTHALLDLAGAGTVHGPRYVAQLRAEITEVLARHDGAWSRRALAEMHKLDSTLRESLRKNSFVTVGTPRIVVGEAGVVTPSGVFLPAGTAVAVHAYAVLHDPDIYPGPEEFRPFRFAERRVRSREGSHVVDGARLAFATTSPEYLAFGHGRHACPGRFFAASAVKLMLGHIVMNYDFEFVAERPRNFWIGVNRVPDMKASIQIKRREGR